MKVSKRFFICILLLFVSWCVMMVSSCLSFRSLSFLIGTRTTPRRISSSRIFASSSAIEKQQQSLEQQYDRTTMATNTSGADMNDRQFSTSTSQQQEQPNQNKNIIPRAAAAVTLQCGSHFLLIQRGKPPNKGHWSLPGGKTEAGETSMQAAKRELSEECIFLSDHNDKQQKRYRPKLQWHEDGPFTASDVVLYDPETGDVAYHYLIAQCYCRIDNTNNIYNSTNLPRVQGGDDASQAKWFTIQEMKSFRQNISEGVIEVIERSQILHEAGVLCLDL